MLEDILTYELSESLSTLTKDFKNKNRDELNGLMLLFKVKECNTHITFYTISFSIDGDYRDIFLSSAVIEDDEFIIRECVDGHEDDYSTDIKNGLYIYLSKCPCYTLNELSRNGFDYDYSSGSLNYETINYKELV